MTKFIDKEGNKLLAGTVLYDGSTSENFTLSDSVDNYEYIQVFYRPHSTLGQQTQMMIAGKTTTMHLSAVQTISGVTTVYRCQMQFNDKTVSLSGRTQVINGGSADGIEAIIFRVIGY